MTDNGDQHLIDYHLGRERVGSCNGSAKSSNKSWSRDSSCDDDRSKIAIRKAGYVKP